MGFAFAAVLTVAIAACGSDATAEQVASAAPARDIRVPTAATQQGEAPDPVVKVGNSVGDHIPDFELRLEGGLTASSAALLAERRPAFLFFFATW